MLAVPVIVELNVTEHEAELGIVPGTSVHGLPVKAAPVDIPIWLKVTVPVGEIPVPGDASELIVAVQLLGCGGVVIVLGGQVSVVLGDRLSSAIVVGSGVSAERVVWPLYGGASGSGDG